LGEVVPTSSMVFPIRVRVPSIKIVQGGTEQVEAPGVVSEAAVWMCQARLFPAVMVSRADFNPAAVSRWRSQCVSEGTLRLPML
jgi:hypothetical protein